MTPNTSESAVGTNAAKPLDELREAAYARKVASGIAMARRLNATSGMAGREQAYGISRELDSIADSYRYMLRYMLDGHADDSRGQMIDGLCHRLLNVADTLERLSLRDSSGRPYFTAARFTALGNKSLKEKIDIYMAEAGKAALAVEAGVAAGETGRLKDDLLIDIFRQVRSMADAPAADYEAIHDVLGNPDTPYELASQLITALMLANIEYFDEKGFALLLEAASDEMPPLLAVRGLTALIIVARHNRRRIALHPRSYGRLKALSESIVQYGRIRTVMTNMLMARDTDRIVKRLNDEVIPGLMKIRPDVMRNLRKAGNEPDFGSMEENPEWEEILKKSGVEKQLRELTDIQMEGGDVMMGAFSRLKSFPFFREESHWFLPFDPRHSSLAGKFVAEEPFKTMLESNRDMCDSDKYSLAFSLAGMPALQRNAVSMQLDAQLQQLNEALAEARLKAAAPDFDTEARRFMRDIYRYSKIHEKDTLERLLSEPVTPDDLPALSDFMESDEFLNLLAEFHFKRKYHHDALPLLEILSKRRSSDPTLMEKVGYCRYMEGDLSGALEWYRRAELFKPDSIWLWRQTALCLKQTGQFEEAGAYYRKLLDSSPDNYGLIMNLGHCSLQNGDYDEALRQYYHALYINPDNAKPRRAIAWVELLKGNYDKSRECYSRLLSSESECDDLLNYGHLNFLTGNYREAATLYRRYASMCGLNPEELARQIADDYDVISRCGGNPEELRLVLESVILDSQGAS